jgi:hypothetical protein
VLFEADSCSHFAGNVFEPSDVLDKCWFSGFLLAPDLHCRSTLADAHHVLVWLAHMDTSPCSLGRRVFMMQPCDGGTAESGLLWS